MPREVAHVRKPVRIVWANRPRVEALGRSLIVGKAERAAGVGEIQGRILLIPLLVSEFKLMLAPEPGQGVIEAKSVVDCVSVHRIADVDHIRLVDDREHAARGTSLDSQHLVPILSTSYANPGPEILAVGAVVTEVQVVQYA